MTDLTTVFLTFLAYSIFGWALEIILCSYSYKKLVNRGFLFGPYCPIYGVGALLILWSLQNYYDDPVVIFVFCIIIATFVEYFTSYVLEKIFHNKWWNYSGRIDNINGRICVGNMLGFGVFGCAAIYVIQPFIENNIFTLSNTFLNVFSIVAAIIFVIDVIYSIIIAYALRHRIIIAEELKAEKIKMIPSLVEKKFKNQISKLHFKTIRLFKAFPALKNINGEELDLIRKLTIKYKKEQKKFKMKKK